MNAFEKQRLCLKLAAMDLPQSGVSFHFADAQLQELMTRAETQAAANIVPMCPSMSALVEGGGYPHIWVETQPMGGEMYAKRNLRVALNNQLFFLLCQRGDGRLPGCIIPTSRLQPDWWRDPVYRYSSAEWEPLGLVADFGQLQGNALPYPAFKMYYLAGKPEGYLQLLAECVEAYDAYLWKTRDPYNEGVLQIWCLWDTGEDNCHRFGGSPNRWPHDYPPDGEATPNQSGEEDRIKYYQWCSERQLCEPIQVPMRSMDMMAFSHECRATRALISDVLGDGRGDYWREQAAQVRRALKRHLWRPEKGAAFDKDRDNRWMDILIHNNLRCMHYGAFDQEMADEFIRRHLLNPEEFLTPVPLPSIAVNDPVFFCDTDNNWSGQPQGLTWQRAIRALENYGRYAELTLLGRLFLKAMKAAGVFPQQLDPFHPEAPAKDYQGPGGYGPIILAVMEYVAKFYGIGIERDRVQWSGLPDGGAVEYTQRLGEKTYALRNDGRCFTASVNGEECFQCTAGVRVVTGMDGVPMEIVGIDTVAHEVCLQAGAARHSLRVEPNQIWSLAGGSPALAVERPSFV